MKNNYQRLFIYSTTLLLACLNVLVIPRILDLPAIAITKSPKATADDLVQQKADGSRSDANPEEKKATEEPDAKKELEKATKRKAAEASNSQMTWQILNGLAILLHVLEVAGLVGVFIILKKYNDKMESRRHEIKQLERNIIVLEEKPKAQVSNHSSSIPTLVSRLDRMENQISSLKNSLSTNSFQQSQPSRSLPPAPSAMKSSGYAFLDLYKQNPDACKSQYSVIKVSENEENIQKRWDGQQQDIILEESRRGNYWLIDERGTTYLVPASNLRITEANMGTVRELFDCENYTPNYSSVDIVQPAIVKAQPGISQRWKLYQKGVLAFV
jgi:myosin heavy subunit